MSKATKIPRNHMKVTSTGEALKFKEYGELILKSEEFDQLVIMGSGSSIEVAIKVAEQLRQTIPNLHQVIDISSEKVLKKQRMPDHLNEPDVDIPDIIINMTCINITLAKGLGNLNRDHPGYQEPLSEREFKEFNASMQNRMRGRGGIQGRGMRGRGFRARGRGGGRGETRFEDRVPYSKDDFYVQRGRDPDMRGGRGRYRGRGDERGGRFRGGRGGFMDFDHQRGRPYGHMHHEDDRDEHDHGIEHDRFEERFGGGGHRYRGGRGDGFRGRGRRYNDFDEREREREFPEHFQEGRGRARYNDPEFRGGHDREFRGGHDREFRGGHDRGRGRYIRDFNDREGGMRGSFRGDQQFERDFERNFERERDFERDFEREFQQREFDRGRGYDRGRGLERGRGYDRGRGFDRDFDRGRGFNRGRGFGPDHDFEEGHFNRGRYGDRGRFMERGRYGDRGRFGERGAFRGDFRGEYRGRGGFDRGRGRPYSPNEREFGGRGRGRGREFSPDEREFGGRGRGMGRGRSPEDEEFGGRGARRGNFRGNHFRGTRGRPEMGMGGNRERNFSPDSGTPRQNETSDRYYNEAPQNQRGAYKQRRYN